VRASLFFGGLAYGDGPLLGASNATRRDSCVVRIVCDCDMHLMVLRTSENDRISKWELLSCSEIDLS
jgi:hypothetical protein